METILIFPLLIAATVAVYTLAAKIINSAGNTTYNANPAEFERSLETLCRMFPSLQEEQLRALLMKSSGSLEKTISTLLDMNAKRESQNTKAYQGTGLDSKFHPTNQPDHTWYDDPILRHQSLQQRKAAAVEKARSMFLEKKLSQQ